MPSYTFKHHKTGKIQEHKCSIADLDALISFLKESGYKQVIMPIAIKDSGTGR